MSWWNPYSVDAEVAKGQELDRTLDELNRAKYEAGQITGEEYDRRKLEQAPNAAETYNVQVDEAFKAGWREGEQTVTTVIKDTVSGVTGAVGSVVGAPLKGILGGLPWWVWIGGILALLAYAGLLPAAIASVRAAVAKKS